MKMSLLASALCFGLFVNALAQTNPGSTTVTTAPATCKLTVVFTNVINRTGKIYVGLANDSASFDGSSYRKTRIEVQPMGETRVTFEGLPTGRYAVRMYQDLNENQKTDRENGIPTEPFGFSNVTRLTGRPSFEQCAVELTGDTTITVSLIQM
jgi:uncharacterized protein (DUF2141 family)